MSTDPSREIWVREDKKTREPVQTSFMARSFVVCCDGESCPACSVVRYVPEREWITGSGAELPENTWAYVNHPTYGVQLAQLTYYSDTDPYEPEHRVWYWTMYDVGQAVLVGEVTDHQPLGPLPAAPERKP